MTSEQRKIAFVALGKEIQASLNPNTPQDELNVRQVQLRTIIERIHTNNGWFTEENVKNVLLNISSMLAEEAMNEWISNYDLPDNDEESLLTVGVVMAGNIPAVGFHDFLCILMAGGCVKAKLSSSDAVLIPALAAMLLAIEPEFATRISFTEDRLLEIEAIIATGSNNSSRYFDYYFSRFPNIIRKNRTSVAVITGNEDADELKLLFNDIFQYFGQGCRSVSKLFVPADYDLIPFLNAAKGWEHTAENKKYFNNYEYNKAIYLVNSIPHFDNGFLLMKEDESFHSPVSVLFYERYDKLKDVKDKLELNNEILQCVVSSSLEGVKTVPFGCSQSPKLNDYADGIDTMNFLLLQKVAK